MTVLVLSDPANLTVADATLVANNNAALKALLNGNVDNANIAAAAAIALTKLALGANGQIIVMRGSTPTWVSAGALFAEVATDESTVSAAYADLATVGPSVTAPFTGDYLISFGCLTYNQTDGTRANKVAVKLGAAAAADAEMIQMDPLAANKIMAGSRTIKRTLTSGDVIKLVYNTSGGSTGSFKNRWLRLEAA